MNQWQKEVLESLLDSEEEALKDLERQYKQALNQIGKKIKLFQSDLDMLNEAVNTEGLEDAAKNILLSQARSKVYQKQYQEALYSQISGILDQMHGRNYSTIETYLKQTYEDGYLGTMYDLSQQGIPVITPINQAQATQAILLDSKVVKGYYDRLGVDVGKLKKVITQEVSRGIASSLPYAEIARNIDNASRSGLYNAQRIARTEGHRIQNTASRDAANEAKAHGADLVKIWDATLDGKTRDSHRMVDGQVRELDEKFSNGLDRPGDPSGGASEVINCRCVEIHKPRWALDDGFIKMDNFTGELRTFESPKDYEDFKKKYWSAENQEYMSYVQDLETKYGTKNFETILGSMSDREYQHFKQLEDASPMWKTTGSSGKMAASASENDWSKTVLMTVTKQERKEILQYAKEKGVAIGDIKSFDGDPDLLRSQIDAISRIQSELPIGKKVIINVGKLSDDDFGATQQQTITINAKALRDRKITEANILAGHKFASKTVEDIGVHEYGHAFASIKVNRGLEIAQQAYYNAYGTELSEDGIREFLSTHVSIYSVLGKNDSEIIPEVLAKNNSTASVFTKEFVELLKKV